jgi:hypothetical protein
MPTIFIKTSQTFFGESCLIQAKKICSQKLTNKGKKKTIYQISHQKKNSESFDEH